MNLHVASFETCRMLKNDYHHTYAGIKNIGWFDEIYAVVSAGVLFWHFIMRPAQVTFATSGLPAWWQIREKTWMKYQKVIWYSSSTWLTSSASSRHAGFLWVEWRVDQHSDEMFINTTHPSMKLHMPLSWIWMKSIGLIHRTCSIKKNLIS